MSSPSNATGAVWEDGEAGPDNGVRSASPAAPVAAVMEQRLSALRLLAATLPEALGTPAPIRALRASAGR